MGACAPDRPTQFMAKMNVAKYVRPMMIVLTVMEMFWACGAASCSVSI
jgi:hypothetical protein